MKCFDIQVNGGFGVDFSAPELTADDFIRATESILKTGVTRFLPTIITSSMSHYRSKRSRICQYPFWQSFLQQFRVALRIHQLQFLHL